MSSLKWVRLDVQFAMNPKVLALIEDKSWRAVSTYTFGLGYCGAHGTDGFIPRSALPFLHGTKREADQLVSVGLWIPASKGGWDVNGWADYQPSTSEQAGRSARMRALAQSRWRDRYPESEARNA